jgi:hypothetical protein
MSEDLISDNFIETIDRALLKRYLKILKILLILSFIHYSFELLQWFFYLKNNKSFSTNSIDLYTFLIAPILRISIIAASFLGWVYYLKGNKLIVKSFETNEPEVLNEGYKSCCKSVLISIAIFTISIIDFLAQFILEILSL